MLVQIPSNIISAQNIRSYIIKLSTNLLQFTVMRIINSLVIGVGLLILFASEQIIVNVAIETFGKFVREFSIKALL